MDYQKILTTLQTFRDQRGWQKYHNLKDLAISVNLEASEILEIFQWRASDAALTSAETKHLKEEIADTLIYLIFMCDRLNIDPEEIIMEKMRVNQTRTWHVADEQL